MKIACLLLVPATEDSTGMRGIQYFFPHTTQHRYAYRRSSGKNKGVGSGC